MPMIDVTVECPVFDSFRVQQAAGLFDVPLGEKSHEAFSVELPGADEAWDVGLIVGPSGSGKSTIAARAFAADLYRGADWPTDRAVIDAFGDVPLKQVIELLTAVGFSSPPSWVKPYQVLSCGEKFRCDLARALAKGSGFGVQDSATEDDGTGHAEVRRGVRPADLALDQGGDADPSADLGVTGLPPCARATSGRPCSVAPLTVFDEFTSVVDRNVARACATAIGKGIRSGHIAARFVAVTCHYDVAEWLEPDWVLDMATRTLTRRRLRRPQFTVEIRKSGVDAWPLFARHHYLSGSLARGARCYLATWDGEPVTFCATLPVITKRGHRRFTRIVTLPDYQGMGIGMRVVAAVAQLHRDEGLRINLTSSHPAVIRHCRRSPLWRAVNVKKAGASPRGTNRIPAYKSSAGRAVVSFEYVGGV